MAVRRGSAWTRGLGSHSPAGAPRGRTPTSRETPMASSSRGQPPRNLLDRPLPKGKQEVRARARASRRTCADSHTRRCSGRVCHDACACAAVGEPERVRLPLLRIHPVLAVARRHRGSTASQVRRAAPARRWPADRIALARARRLKDAGEGIGRRVLELASHRDKSHKRETRMLGILQFVTTNVWKMLFGVRPPPSRRPRSPIAREREKETIPRTPCEQTARAAGDG